MVTMVVGCTSRTNSLWYMIFAPNELAATYIPGSLVSTRSTVCCATANELFTKRYMYMVCIELNRKRLLCRLTHHLVSIAIELQIYLWQTFRKKTYVGITIIHSVRPLGITIIHSVRPQLRCADGRWWHKKWRLCCRVMFYRHRCW